MASIQYRDIFWLARVRKAGFFPFESVLMKNLAKMALGEVARAQD